MNSGTFIRKDYFRIMILLVLIASFLIRRVELHPVDFSGHAHEITKRGNVFDQSLRNKFQSDFNKFQFRKFEISIYKPASKFC